MARSKKRLWGFDDGEREVLVAATAAIPGLRGVVERAGRRAELRGLWVVEASVDELDEMYSLVEALMDGTRVPCKPTRATSSTLMTTCGPFARTLRECNPAAHSAV